MTIRIGNAIVTLSDAEGSTRIGKRTYRWDYADRYGGGPTFLGADGNPLARQPGEHHPVWPRFNRWLRRWKKQKAQRNSHENLMALKKAHQDAENALSQAKHAMFPVGAKVRVECKSGFLCDGVVDGQWASVGLVAVKGPDSVFVIEIENVRRID